MSGPQDSAARANRSGTLAAARVLVVDVTRLVEPIAADPTLTDAERVTQARALSEAIGQAVAEQVAAGAIVLEADAVYAAPPDAYVRP